MLEPNIIHVAVGVILNENNQVLVAKRPVDSHKGGFWEFPGGKKEESESIETALQRELFEELGIRVTRFRPFTKILYNYPEKSVLLDVWLITGFEGQAVGKEGQAIDWRNIQDLQAEDFPEANAAIVKRINLSSEMAITPNLNSKDELDSVFRSYAEARLKLVQFRQTHLEAQEFNDWLVRAQSLAIEHEIQLISNQASVTLIDSLPHGVHVNAATLMSLTRRPVPAELLFSASCHNIEELQLAESLDADFVTLSPVNSTAKYESGSELGWDLFADLANSVSLPVFALGGLKREDLEFARANGAFGIAGISTYLDSF